MLKILLDIDGVMVITPTWRRPDFLADGFMAFDRRCAFHLAELVQSTNAEIVLTSTHRIHYDEITWQQLFANRGIFVEKISKINKVTSYLDFTTRDKEIKSWVKRNPNENFIIIDDDKSLRNLPPDIQQFWVETQFLTGFDKACQTKAYEIINNHFI